MVTRVKKGISLIVLVITIIVLAILAAAVIISISNSNIMTKARISTFKSDMQSLKEIYSNWLANYIFENNDYDMDSINYVVGDSTFLNDIMKGQVSDKYKDGLKVEKGKLVYITEDLEQIEVLDDIDMSEEKIDTPQYNLMHVSNITGFTFDNGVGTILADVENFDMYDNSLYVQYESLSEVYYEKYLKFWENKIYTSSNTLKSDAELENVLATLYGFENFDEALVYWGVEDRVVFQTLIGSSTYSESLKDAIMSEDDEVEKLREIDFISTNLFKSGSFDVEVAKEYMILIYYPLYTIEKYAYSTTFDITTFEEYFNEFYCTTFEEFKEDLNDSSILKYNDNSVLKISLFEFIDALGYATDLTYNFEGDMINVTSLPDIYLNFFAVPGQTYTFTTSNNETISLEVPMDYYNITVNLNNCNYVTSYVKYAHIIGASDLNSGRFGACGNYNSKLVAPYGYDIDNSTVSITMGETNITNSVYNSTTNEINIPNITGNVVITADTVATSQVASTSAKIKDANGVTQILTPENVKDYYGMKVSNYTAGGETYRVFFVDFYGKFGNAGTVYLKADYKEGRTIDFNDNEEDRTVYFQFSRKTSNTLKIDQMNPMWALINGTEKESIWTVADEYVGNLCDTANWTTYCDNEKADFAIGSPSVEMFIASYNQVPHSTSGTLNIMYSSLILEQIKGYNYIYNGSCFESIYKSQLDSSGYHNIYVGENNWNLSSTFGRFINTVCGDYGSNYNSLGYGFILGNICPIVSLKSTFTAELVND